MYIVYPFSGACNFPLILVYTFYAFKSFILFNQMKRKNNESYLRILKSFD